MKVTKTKLAGVLIVEPKVFRDSRGFFVETYSSDRYRQAGITKGFVQDNHSRSSESILRGLHYQLKHPQGKLVHVIQGEVFDVAVDVRYGSPTFGHWVGVVLSGDNQKQLYVPPGFAHGFQVLTPSVDFAYKCTDYYDPQDEHGIAWDDPALAIDWPKKDDAILSEKDRLNPNLSDVHVSNLPVFNNK